MNLPLGQFQSRFLVQLPFFFYFFSNRIRKNVNLRNVSRITLEPISIDWFNPHASTVLHDSKTRKHFSKKTVDLIFGYTRKYTSSELSNFKTTLGVSLVIKSLLNLQCTQSGPFLKLLNRLSKPCGLN